jgi:hypothetical protein
VYAGTGYRLLFGSSPAKSRNASPLEIRTYLDSSQPLNRPTATIRQPIELVLCGVMSNQGEETQMDHDTAIRLLAESNTALARIAHSQLDRLGIDDSTRELLEAVEAQADSVYLAFGGTVEADLSQGAE